MKFANLDPKSLCKKNIDDLITRFPGFNKLKDIDIAHSNQRAWKREQQTTYDVSIIFIGKTGYGKSTSINQVVGDKIFESNDITSCTKQCQSVDYLISEFDKDHYLSIRDLPGLGESAYHDEKYLSLYASYLEKTDVVVYVLRADSRDFSIDEMAFRRLFQDSATQKRVIIAVNCADKIEPFTRTIPFEPSEEQLSNINKKISEISTFFKVPKKRIVAYSATEEWNVNSLAKTISGVLLDNLYDEKPVYVSSSSPDLRDIVVGGVSDAVETGAGAVCKGIESAGRGAANVIETLIVNPLSRAGCFITTATCMALGKDDNCSELNAFRMFRDQWLLRQQGGSDLVAEYYSIAPKILKGILSLKNDKILLDVWDRHLCPCLSLISEMRFQEAKVAYIVMVRELELKYLS
ncbi:MAG: 50S ribosome-binding GTPase [Chlorobium sp.]|nr:50S ribosome-binding GTPase [Chlorobium sp.]